MNRLHGFCLLLGTAALALCLIPPEAPSAPGDFYVADTLSDQISRFTPNGEKSTFASGLRQAIGGLAFDTRGNLFVGDSGHVIGGLPEDSIIYKYTPDGTQSTFVDLGLVDLWAMAFDGAGNLFVSTGTEILNLAPDGTQTTFASGLDTVTSLTFDAAGNLYAGLIETGPGHILKFTPDGQRSTFFAAATSNGVTALAFDDEGNLFAEVGESIIKIAPDATSTTFASGDFASNSLAFDGSGNLFAGVISFASTDPAIVKFSPDGTKTTFAFGPLSPWGVAFEPVTEKLRNISARGLVETGDNVLIGGFIVGGNALANNAVIVRAIGPSLSKAGISNPLPDPMLELHSSSGAIIASNDDWQDTQAEQITATGLAPTDPSESAIFATLPAGNYTAVVRGAGGTSGVALVEVYSITQ